MQTRQKLIKRNTVIGSARAKRSEREEADAMTVFHSALHV